LSTHFPDSEVRSAPLLDSDRPIGVLPDEIVAQLKGAETTTTRSVSLSVQSERHAVNGRRKVSQQDADFVAQHGAEAPENITRVELYKLHRWRLICDVPSQKRGLALALKFVPKYRARTARDEFWIETMFPQTRRAGSKGR
jgi:hypothetical protein